MTISLTIGIIVYVLEVIGMWLAFRKAGRWGWLSIIPIVNTIVICLIGWRKVWPIILQIFLGVVGAVCLVYGGALAIIAVIGLDLSFGSIFALLVIGIVLLIITLVIFIMMIHRLSKSFGYRAGFTVGLILIPFIMYPVLGFGNSEYLYEKKRDLSR